MWWLSTEYMDISLQISNFIHLTRKDACIKSRISSIDLVHREQNKSAWSAGILVMKLMLAIYEHKRLTLISKIQNRIWL
jgi:hypothetical protein